MDLHLPSLPAGCTPIGRAAPERALRLVLHLRRHPKLAAHLRQHHQREPGARWLEGALLPLGLRIVDHDLGSRALAVETTVGDAERAFQVQLWRVAGPAGEHLWPDRRPTPPGPLAKRLLAVHGLDRRPISQRRSPQLGLADEAAVRAAAAGLSPVDQAARYGLPEGTGEGCRITVLQFGGGFVERELRAALRETLGEDGPEIEVASILGASNNVADVDGSREVMLDLQVLGALAPKAKIKVLFAPNDAMGWPEALRQAVHDAATPHVISVSWGAVEAAWPQDARDSIARSLQDATSLGVTVCCSSGDLGSEPDASGSPQVQFPASSPDALACGGTSAAPTADQDEVVWRDRAQATGGGISRSFPVPPWQAAAAPGKHLVTGKAGRGVPDVAAHASPTSGWRIRTNDGRWTVMGGTSAVAPLWAAIVARACAASADRVGLAQPRLYAAGDLVFRSVTRGGNGIGGARGYEARAGWDPCTGLGSPKGDKVLEALMAKA
jgi:kumamolisin